MVASISSPILNPLLSLCSLGSWLVRDIAAQSRSGGPSVIRWLALTMLVLVSLTIPTIVFAMVG